MSSKTQDKIYETFVAVSGGHPASVQSWIDASERIEKPGARTGGQMRTAKPVTWRAVSTSAGTGKSTASTEGSGSSVASTVLQSVFQGVPLAGAVAGATGGTGGGGIGSTIESIASTVLKSGLGMVPLIGGLLGLFGGAIISTFMFGMDWRQYWSTSYQILVFQDVFMGLLKPVLFGFIIATIGCYYGLTARGGTQGVGRATTQAVVASSVLILVTDLLVTKLLMSVFAYQ